MSRWLDLAKEKHREDALKALREEVKAVEADVCVDNVVGLEDWRLRARIRSVVENTKAGA